MGGAITLTIASSDDMGRLQEAVRGFVADEALSEKGAYTLDLVLEEIVTNIAHHGAGPSGATITISLSRGGNRLTGNVSDDAPPFDPLAMPGADTETSIEDRPVGGLGIHLVKEMTDHLTYAFKDGRNVLEFVIDLSGKAR